MKATPLAAAALATVIVGTSWISPVMAIPGWQFIRELFSGGEPGIVGSRGGIRGDIPYLITPRKTAVLSSTPSFQWNAVATASSYTVTLWGPDGILWETIARTNRIDYPAFPPLEPGTNYALTVKTEHQQGNNGPVAVASTDEGVPGLGFSVLTETDTVQLARQLEAIASDLDPVVAGLERARIYREYALMGEAIRLLESLRVDAPDSIECHRLLGELYLQISLNRRARSMFTRSRSLATEAGDLAEQADASVFLAHIALSDRDSETAIQLLTEAQTLYSTVNNPSKRDAVIDWLATF